MRITAFNLTNIDKIHSHLCKFNIVSLVSARRRKAIAMPNKRAAMQAYRLTEAFTIVGNPYSIIPENLVFKKTTEKSRREIIQDLLSNDPRNKHEQAWTLEKKKKNRGQVPRCRTCRKIQNEDEVTVTVKGLYVP